MALRFWHSMCGLLTAVPVDMIEPDTPTLYQGAWHANASSEPQGRTRRQGADYAFDSGSSEFVSRLDASDNRPTALDLHFNRPMSGLTLAF